MLTEPPTDPPVTLDPGPPTPDPPPAAGAPVIGGVGLEIGRRLDIDPLWPRLAFVGLTLAGGLGIVLYAGLWLLLVVGAAPGRTLARAAGLAVLGIGVVLLLDGSTRFMDSPWMLAAGLVGVAIALWQPRGVDVPPAPSEEAATPSVVIEDAATSRRRWARPARRPSVLGRITFGVALVVAAVGALVDQANGGRLHPEQWLGAAAAICGLGVFVSAWWGRAAWLVLPALAFAGSGFVAGHAARAGVEELSFGSTYEQVGPGWSSGVRRIDRVAGEINLDVFGAPDDVPQTVDVRIGIGELRLTVADGVAVEVRPDLDSGTAFVDGLPVGTDEPISVGPDGPPDVVVTASISDGDVFVMRRARLVIERPPVAPLAPIPGDGPVLDLGEGLTMASDGTVLLPDGAGAVGPDGELWLNGGTRKPRADGVTAIVTANGTEYLLLPNLMIITPAGTLIDVPAARDRLAEVN